MNNEYRKASDLVSALFDGLIDEGMQKSNSIVRIWKECVGEKIAAHSKIIDVNKGILVIEVSHPGWSQQILFKKSHIIQAISRSYPELAIKSLSIRVIPDCQIPYQRNAEDVGAGIPRIESLEPDVQIRSDVPEELQQILNKLKTSIRKGKPQE